MFVILLANMVKTAMELIVGIPIKCYMTHIYNFEEKTEKKQSNHLQDHTHTHT